MGSCLSYVHTWKAAVHKGLRAYSTGKAVIIMNAYAQYG